jgi:hypothetical protein
MDSKGVRAVQADLVHAFLSVSDLQHSVVSPLAFRLEYRRGTTAPAMFQRQVSTLPPHPFRLEYRRDTTALAMFET